MTYMLAADTGGTFTDLAAYDESNGSIVYSKSLTTYDDLVDGMMRCIGKSTVDVAEAESVKFGTTLVINTYVQRSGARTALVTTSGFRDILEIARGNRPVPFDLRFRREPPLIGRALRFTVDERMSADGDVITPLDVGQLRILAARLRDLEIEAVAVSFLNSYANDVHERRAAEELRRLLPHAYVSAGAELSREWYEYERTSTVAANAYVGPKLHEHVDRLNHRLGDEGFRGSFFLMASNGGVFSAQRAKERPVMLVESGPVGGCIGAGVYAAALGLDKVVAFDMGGTTAKCAVLENGRFEVKSPYYVGGYERGFPVRGGVLDIVEVGAGGGSVAWQDRHGSLHVGPRSAGSTPGPACYGRGGVEPTITDANLVLGRISASSFLGGEMPLDLEAAVTAIATLAAKIGLDGEADIDRTAQGILSLGGLTMATAIKQITVERGLDPRELSIIAFGGGGPLHTAALARELNIPRLVIPPEPGNFSALGMILADARVDETKTFLAPLNGEGVAAMAAGFLEMQEMVSRKMAGDVGFKEILFERQVELGFVGQRHSIRVKLGAESDAGRIRDAFEAAYRRRYGHVEDGSPIQIMSLVLTATAPARRPSLERLSPAIGASRIGTPSSRPVFFVERGGRVETPVFQRHALPSGFAASGPAIIEEHGSTTVVGPDDRFEIGRLGEINIHFEQKGNQP